MPLSRARPFAPERSALLIVDAQNGVFNPEQERARPEFFAAARDRAIPNMARLLAAFRGAGAEVAHIVIRSLTADGRDRSLDYKLSGFHYAPDSWEARPIHALAPLPGEILFGKTSSSAFNSTNIDYVLRNIGVTDLFVVGFLTDQCIDHTVKDAADRGYYPTCVHDSCMAETEARHRAALDCFRGYCRMLSTNEALALIAPGQAHAGCGMDCP